jgi:hypothetical protein
MVSHAQLTCKGCPHVDLYIMDMESITPDTAQGAIPNASPIEGEHLPAIIIIKVAFEVRSTDTKVGVGTLHHLSTHPGDV